jgi:L-fucose isomerase-like protein
LKQRRKGNRARPRGVEVRRGGNLCRVAALRRALQEAREEIDGIIVTLPNFGEERGIVDAIRLSGLKVPVLVQATPDRSDAMTIATRRDSFCGKMSACNNLMQYGIPYSLTTLHTRAWLARVQGRSGVVLAGLPHREGAEESAHRRHRRASHGLQHRALLRAHSSRPAASPSRPLDLSEIFGRINKMKDTDDAAQAKLAAIKSYVTTAGIPEAALLKMAKLGAVIDGWMKQTTSPSAPCSAGPRWKSSSAWCPAPS